MHFGLATDLKKAMVTDEVPMNIDAATHQPLWTQ
jgi:hypothetical protein